MDESDSIQLQIVPSNNPDLNLKFTYFPSTSVPSVLSNGFFLSLKARNLARASCTAFSAALRYAACSLTSFSALRSRSLFIPKETELYNPECAEIYIVHIQRKTDLLLCKIP